MGGRGGRERRTKAGGRGREGTRVDLEWRAGGGGGERRAGGGWRREGGGRREGGRGGWGRGGQKEILPEGGIDQMY